jgi:hypothetical protein
MCCKADHAPLCTPSEQGVEVHHSGIVNTVHYYKTAVCPVPHMGAGSMCFQTMPFIFDGSVMDLWCESCCVSC